MEIEDMKGEGNVSHIISGIEGDMGQSTRLGFLIQADGDIILSLLDKETGRRLSIEFCKPGSGGGRNPMVFRGLHAIVSQLIEKESGKNISNQSEKKKHSQ